ncbi:hypothetical protein LEMLEM_LOCUS22073 [Lemmus lemmus]
MKGLVDSEGPAEGPTSEPETEGGTQTPASGTTVKERALWHGEQNTFCSMVLLHRQKASELKSVTQSSLRPRA